ncbi:MAG: 3-ketoacyl-ACP reductase [Pseudonocardia sp. SCN 72-86]|nr:MAG: 3-ketoacyl-ACP reductase [Pseudonocardia sp. SCN 72-86]
MTGPDGEFVGRAALVTGASRGIGRAVAAELLRRGAAVAITARKPGPLAETVEQLADEAAGGDGARVIGIAGNAGSDEDRRDAVEQTLAAFGRLDVLINNAGINPVAGPLMSVDLAAVRKIFDVNVVAAIGFTQLAVRGWMGEHGGTVINVASVGGLRSTGAIAAYGASKAALIRLTDELATELGPGIRVNAVAPAVVKTDFAAMLYADDEAKAASVYPLKRLGLPQDVADLIAFLASDRAGWITGETVRIDGGTLASGRVFMDGPEAG